MPNPRLRLIRKTRTNQEKRTRTSRFIPRMMPKLVNRKGERCVTQPHPAEHERETNARALCRPLPERRQERRQSFRPSQEKGKDGQINQSRSGRPSGQCSTAVSYKLSRPLLYKAITSVHEMFKFAVNSHSLRRYGATGRPIPSLCWDRPVKPR